MARTDPQVNIRMPAELKAKLDDAAKDSGRSLNAELIARLEASLDPKNNSATVSQQLGYLTGTMSAARTTLQIVIDGLEAEENISAERLRWLKNIERILYRVWDPSPETQAKHPEVVGIIPQEIKEIQKQHDDKDELEIKAMREEYYKKKGQDKKT